MHNVNVPHPHLLWRKLFMTSFLPLMLSVVLTFLMYSGRVINLHICKLDMLLTLMTFLLGLKRVPVY